MSFYESPLFVELLIDSIYLLFLFALALTGWSAVRSLYLHRGKTGDNGVPARTIVWGVVALMVLTLLLTALLADVNPMTINGHTFTDTFWLRVSDMLINTSIVLILVAVTGIALGTMGIGRKIR